MFDVSVREIVAIMRRKEGLSELFLCLNIHEVL